MKLGDIIYYKKLTFSDGVNDIKQNRPCIYLFDEKIGNKYYTYSIPITSNVKSFNKFSNDLVFIPETIYSYRKLSFAQIGNIVVLPTEQVVDTGLRLSTHTMINIINRVYSYKAFSKDAKYIQLYKDVKNILGYIEPKQKRK